MTTIQQPDQPRDGVDDLDPAEALRALGVEIWTIGNGMLLLDLRSAGAADQGADPHALAGFLHRLRTAGPPRVEPDPLALLRLDRAGRVRATLADELTPELAELDPVPHAAIDQAKRLAGWRTTLLRQGAYTLPSLADGRRQTTTALRQWVHRARQRRQIFTVKHDGETLVPAFLLDEHLAPRPEYRGAITALTEAGEDGWALWTWFASPSSWLDGAVPADRARTEPASVAEAARRRAANAG